MSLGGDKIVEPLTDEDSDAIFHDPTPNMMSLTDRRLCPEGSLLSPGQPVDWPDSAHSDAYAVSPSSCLN